MSSTSNLEAVLASGKDGATLRFALGSSYLRAGEAERALTHLAVAVRLDPDYSAAWKHLGRAQTQAGLTEDAKESYREGIRAAARKGDVQAGKEMRVLLKRLEAASSGKE